MNKNKIYGNKSNNKEEASMGMKEERPQHTENENKRADKTLRCELVKPFQWKKKDLTKNVSNLNPCNVYHCRECHKGEEMKRRKSMSSEEEAKQYPGVRKYKNFKCPFRCQYCRTYIIAKEEERCLEYAFNEELYRERASRSNNNENEDIINVTKDTKDEVKNKISNLNNSDFIKINVPKDGNCFYHAVLKSTGEQEDRNIELKHQVSDYIDVTEYFLIRLFFLNSNFFLRRDFFCFFSRCNIQFR